MSLPPQCLPRTFPPPSPSPTHAPPEPPPLEPNSSPAQDRPTPVAIPPPGTAGATSLEPTRSPAQVVKRGRSGEHLMIMYWAMFHVTTNMLSLPTGCFAVQWAMWKGGALPPVTG